MRYKDLFEYDDLNKEKQEIIAQIEGIESSPSVTKFLKETLH